VLLLVAAAMFANYTVTFRLSGLSPWQAAAIVNFYSVLILTSYTHLLSATPADVITQSGHAGCCFSKAQCLSAIPAGLGGAANTLGVGQRRRLDLNRFFLGHVVYQGTDLTIFHPILVRDQLAATGYVRIDVVQVFRL
jgi:hypothetical protein